MKRPWLYYISPLVLVVVVSLFPIVMGLAADFNLMVLIIFIPIVLLLGVDYFIKWVTHGKILYIWIIEAILVVLFFVLLSHFGNFRISGC